MARAVGLPTANKAESQDICFVAGSVQDFVAKIGGGRGRGDFVTKNGSKVGEHEGIHRFTVGQRRGLNLGGLAEPLYVIGINSEENKVVVGTRDDLKSEGFMVGEMHFVSPSLIREVASLSFPIIREVFVQVRSRHEGTRAILTVTSAETAKIEWVREWAPVSPGQAAVMYDLQNEEVLCGGRIA